MKIHVASLTSSQRFQHKVFKDADPVANIENLIRPQSDWGQYYLAYMSENFG